MRKLQRRIWVETMLTTSNFFSLASTYCVNFLIPLTWKKTKQIQRQNVDCIEPRNILLVGDFKRSLWFFGLNKYVFKE